MFWGYIATHFGDIVTNLGDNETHFGDVLLIIIFFWGGVGMFKKLVKRSKIVFNCGCSDKARKLQ